VRAWHEWLFGRLDVATKLVDDALGWMDEHFGPHHLAFDTLITAGWCHLSNGELTEAASLARRAQSDAAILDGKWDHLQAGYLAARLALVTDDPDHALREIEDLRSRVAFETCRPYADRILGLEIEALASAGGQPSNLAPLINALQPGPRARILRARFVTSKLLDIEADLADSGTWPIAEQLHVGLLLAMRAVSGFDRRPGSTDRPRGEPARDAAHPSLLRRDGRAVVPVCEHDQDQPEVVVPQAGRQYASAGRFTRATTRSALDPTLTSHPGRV